MNEHYPSFDGAPGRRDVIRSLVLLVGILAIASLHYVTDPSQIILHEIYNYLCYVPIIVAANWYGAWGGVAVAAVTSAVFIPHIRMAWAENEAYSASLYAQVVAFHLLGLTLGLLAASQRRLTSRYRDAAVSLERANRQLHDSHEQLRRADRLSALGEIAAGLAHEIRNPLMGVKGALEIVASRVSPGTPEAEFAGASLASGCRSRTAGRELLLIDEWRGWKIARRRIQAARCEECSIVLEAGGSSIRNSNAPATVSA